MLPRLLCLCSGRPGQPLCRMASPNGITNLKRYMRACREPTFAERHFPSVEVSKSASFPSCFFVLNDLFRLCSSKSLPTRLWTAFFTQYAQCAPGRCLLPLCWRHSSVAQVCLVHHTLQCFMLHVVGNGLTSVLRLTIEIYAKQPSTAILNLSWNTAFGIVTTGTVFPIVFAISAAYDNRNKALGHLNLTKVRNDASVAGLGTPCH